MKAASTLTLFLDTGRMIRARMERALPLSFGQCETLRFISESGSPTMREIAAHFKITAPSATAIVEELARSGHVSRSAGLRDRREVRVTLTVKGGRVLKNVTERRARVLSEVLSPLSASDRHDLNRILIKILHNA